MRDPVVLLDPVVLWAAAALGAAAFAAAPSAAALGVAGVVLVLWRRGARPAGMAGCALLLALQAARGIHAVGHARELHELSVTTFTPPAVCVLHATILDSPVASVRGLNGARPVTEAEMEGAAVTTRANVRVRRAGGDASTAGGKTNPAGSEPNRTGGEANRTGREVSHPGEASTCDDRIVPEGLVVRLYDLPDDLRRGDEVEVTAKVLPVHLFEHAELPSPWPTLARSEVVASGAALDVLVVKRSGSLAGWIDAARAHVRRRILATYAPGAAELARALVLGETDLADEDTNAFRDSGLLHLLAVSGTHLVLVVSALSGALRRLLLHVEPLAARMDVGRPAAGLGIAIAWLYADFAGGSGSAVRAAAMLTVVLLARALGGRPSPGRALALGLLGAALVDPLVALDMSFGLSAGATAGLVLLGGPLSARLTALLPADPERGAPAGDGADAPLTEHRSCEDDNRAPGDLADAPLTGHRSCENDNRAPGGDLADAPLTGHRSCQDDRAPKKEGYDVWRAVRRGLLGGGRHVLGSVGTTLAATIGATPALLRYAPKMPVLGVLANILAAPLGELVALPVCLLHAVTSPFGPLERALALAGSGALLVVRQIARVAASVGGGVEVPTPSPVQLAVLAIAGAAVAVSRCRRGRLSAGAAALGALLVLEIVAFRAGAPRGRLRVTALDVGQGDSLLIDFPDGRSMLIDGGGMVGNPVDPGTRVILPVLAARRRSYVDVLALTHPHPDHFTGLATVANNLAFGELWESGQGEMLHVGGPYAALLAAARRRGSPVRRPGDLCGQPRVFGDARVEVLAPCPRVSPETPANDASLVVRIDFGRRSALLVGDAEHEAERALLASGARLRADLLKVGHHGSRTSSSADFLRAVAPGYAMISCGVRNRFGHPHPDALARLGATSAEVLRTDRGGEIVWETDGESVRVLRPDTP